MELTTKDIDRIVEMAWEDRTPFDIIKKNYGLTEGETIKLMRKEMKRSSYEMWRKRMTGRKTKHNQGRSEEIDRFRCSRQSRIHRRSK